MALANSVVLASGVSSLNPVLSVVEGLWIIHRLDVSESIYKLKKSISNKDSKNIINS